MEVTTYTLQPGDPAPPFDLPGVDGRNHTLDGFQGAPLLVVIFSCNHCPYVQAWEQRIIDIQRDYQPRGVRLVAINSNETLGHPTDDFPHMVQRAREKGYNFPYLRDDTQQVARAYGAQVTPQVYVFDAQRRLRYQGRVDDNHKNPRRVKSRDLRDALDALLAGKPAPQP
ncbi:MAG: thioredoxin family protein, partial [Euryarchaeota archaeon]|nr:thioredoxin family protein [Euryarchaeota archaeon]